MNRIPEECLPINSGLVIICTKSRPDDVRQALTFVRADRSNAHVLIVDSSPDLKTSSVCAERAHDQLDLTHVRAIPGLTRQRNVGLEWAGRHGYELVHFIDDDTRVQAGYLAAIEHQFKVDPAVAGVGGTVIDQARPQHIWIKKLFLLYSAKPGVILRSGRNTIGHYQGDDPEWVDWLPGCCMSYRLKSISTHRFDEDLEGYCWGEDFDFGFRVSRQNRLKIASGARVIHPQSPTNRLRTAELAQSRTVLLNRWVKRHRIDGMSLGAFWWSVTGEIALRSVGLIMEPRDREEHMSVIVGTMRGARQILRHRSNP